MTRRQKRAPQPGKARPRRCSETGTVETPRSEPAERARLPPSVHRGGKTGSSKYQRDGGKDRGAGTEKGRSPPWQHREVELGSTSAPPWPTRCKTAPQSRRTRLLPEVPPHSMSDRAESSEEKTDTPTRATSAPLRRSR